MTCLPTKVPTILARSRSAGLGIMLQGLAGSLCACIWMKDPLESDQIGIRLTLDRRARDSGSDDIHLPAWMVIQ